MPEVAGGSPGWSPGLPLRTAGSDTLCAHLWDTFRTPSVGVGWKRPGTGGAGGLLSSAKEWRMAVDAEVGVGLGPRVELGQRCQ